MRTRQTAARRRTVQTPLPTFRPVAKSKKLMIVFELQPTRSNHILGVDQQLPGGLPDFQGLDRIHHAPPVPVSPREGRDRQELIPIEMEKPLDESELQDFRCDKDDGPGEEMTGP